MASDLVPRVVLLVTDLERENAELKSELNEQEDERLLVQITGPNRTPIHYEVSLEDGFSYGDRWCFNLVDQNNGVVRIPLSPFTDLELWLSGILIENFQNVDRLNHCGFDSDDSGTGMGWGNIDFLPGGETRQGKGPVHRICASIGPMTEFDFLKLTDEPSDLEEQITFHDELHLMIEQIEFRKDKIPGIMSLLEKLEIPTTSDSDDDDDDDDDDDVDNDDNDDDDEGLQN